MEISDLKQMPVVELAGRVEQLREDIFQLRCKAVTEPITDPAGLRNKRKEVARIRTIIRKNEFKGSGRTTKHAQRGSRAARQAARLSAARWSARSRRSGKQSGAQRSGKKAES